MNAQSGTVQNPFTSVPPAPPQPADPALEAKRRRRWQTGADTGGRHREREADGDPDAEGRATGWSASHERTTHPAAATAHLDRCVVLLRPLRPRRRLDGRGHERAHGAWGSGRAADVRKGGDPVSQAVHARITAQPVKIRNETVGITECRAGKHRPSRLLSCSSAMGVAPVALAKPDASGSSAMAKAGKIH